MSLQENIDSVRKEFLTDIESLNDSQSNVESVRLKYLSRNGLVSSLFSMLPSLSRNIRPKSGQLLNDLKTYIELEITNCLKQIKDDSKTNSFSGLDSTLPGKTPSFGGTHILEQTLDEIKTIFTSIGFKIEYGPETDDDFHNFGALNFPEHHPARDMQDTFFINEKTVLRTHTSNVQIHLMENQSPPLRYIVPGRVYRNEAISYKSYCLFHQVEGIFVDKNVSFRQLKGCLEYFVSQIFGSEKKMRWRPSYFPFTEPSAEVDIWDEQRNQWLEILGCGMIDPAVFKNIKYDSLVWKGYAFGMGVERIAMLKHGLTDIRLLYNGDIRFLRQF